MEEKSPKDFLLEKIELMCNQFNQVLQLRHKKVMVEAIFLESAEAHWNSTDLIARSLAGEKLKEVDPGAYKQMVDYFKPFLDSFLIAYLPATEICRLLNIAPDQLEIWRENKLLSTQNLNDQILYSWEECRILFSNKPIMTTN